MSKGYIERISETPFGSLHLTMTQDADGKVSATAQTPTNPRTYLTVSKIEYTYYCSYKLDGPSNSWRVTGCSLYRANRGDPTDTARSKIYDAARAAIEVWGASGLEAELALEMATYAVEQAEAEVFAVEQSLKEKKVALQVLQKKLAQVSR